eukprot:TRINITY_DN2098_c0_g1_i1.p1 TRINITY_DN2098_c0_g1~~TRINITY_DN2098_c0_g1_i1.p1  ORF type:complete len:930 (+),score=254.84 TRINITY_DN2098_c0_g1_i1:32-2821(+)
MESSIGSEEAAASNIRVCVRVRPLGPQEEKAKSFHVDHSTITFQNGPKHAFWALDHVLDERASQMDAYEDAKQIIKNVMEGFNGTIFAYGQTGTGKTFTMMGKDYEECLLEPFTSESASHGIIPRALHDIFAFRDENPQREITIGCSYLELYNEKVHDLLNLEGKKLSGAGLEMRELPTKEVVFPDASLVEISTFEEFTELLYQSSSLRAVATTNYNEYSSRSHTIFQVFVMQRWIDDSGTERTLQSKLNLVDLAGSEKWKIFENGEMKEERIREMTSINQSLSALGNCISALLKKKGRTHIPYRNSKLTRILQDSLGGNSKAIFFITLSPSQQALEETSSSLQFADRAKRVRTHAKKNETIDDKTMIKMLQDEVKRLQEIVAVHPTGECCEATSDESLRPPPKFHVAYEDKDFVIASLQQSLDEETQRRRELEGILEAIRLPSDIPGCSSQKDEADEEFERFHSWLRSLPVRFDGKSHKPTIREKFALMEASIVAQAKELQRAKGLFKKDLQSLQQRLLGKSMEVEELKNIQREKEKHKHEQMGDHQMLIEPDTWKHVDVKMLFNEVDKRITASIERIASEASSLVRDEFASGQRELSCRVNKNILSGIETMQADFKSFIYGLTARISSEILKNLSTPMPLQEDPRTVVLDDTALAAKLVQEEMQMHDIGGDHATTLRHTRLHRHELRIKHLMKKCQEALQSVLRLLDDFEWKMRHTSVYVSEESEKTFSDTRHLISKLVMDLRDDECCDGSELSVKRERGFDDTEFESTKERKISERGHGTKSIASPSLKPVEWKETDAPEYSVLPKVSHCLAESCISMRGMSETTVAGPQEKEEKEGQCSPADDKDQEGVDNDEDADRQDDEDLVSSDDESSSFNPLCKSRPGLRDRTNEIQEMRSPSVKKLAKKIPDSIPLFPKLRKKESCDSIS